MQFTSVHSKSLFSNLTEVTENYYSTLKEFNSVAFTLSHDENFGPNHDLYTTWGTYITVSISPFRTSVIITQTDTCPLQKFKDLFLESQQNARSLASTLEGE